MVLLQNISDNIPIVEDKQNTEILSTMENPTKQEDTPASDDKGKEVKIMETDDVVEKEEQAVDNQEEKDSETPQKEQAADEGSVEKVSNESSTKKEEKKTPSKESVTEKEEKKVPLKESPAKESPVKKDNKKKENQENVEAAEEGEEEDEEHKKKKGIFDLPLEVEGKRERHKVERISYSTPTVKKSAALKMGDGVPLGEIEYIEDQIKKHSADELQYLYRLIYGHVGKASIVRREIRKFTGFAFEENSPEFKQKVAYLQRLTLDQLRVIKKILGIDTGGSSKEAIVTSVMVFMMKTVDHKRKVAGKKRKSTAKTPSGKRSRKSKGSDETADDDVEDEEDEEKEKEKEKVSKTPKAPKTPKTPTTVRKPRKKKMSESKEASSKADSDSESERTKKKSKRVLKKDSDDDSSSNTSDDAPQENKPSEQELEKVIEELLATFDLAQVSMKQMCQAVIERFPGTNIGNRVDYLKSKIKQCLSTK